MVYMKDNEHLGWTVLCVDHRAAKEIDRLAEDVRVHLRRIADMIETYGLPQMREPYVKHLAGKLWEMRAKGKDGIARALYVVVVDKQVIILHAFVKKTQQTPRQAIDLAIKRAKEHGLL